MAEEAPVTTVEKGQLKGLIGYNLDGKKFFKFLGIPYAKPPINELRFQVGICILVLIYATNNFHVNDCVSVDI